MDAFNFVKDIFEFAYYIVGVYYLYFCKKQYRCKKRKTRIKK